KPVNDRHGHEAGDQLLATIAARFTDTIDGAFVCRLGGDEFGFLLEGADEHAAIATADRLLTATRAPVAIGPHLARVDASIGIAVADTDREPTTPDEILRRADQAMYQAK